MRRVLMGSVVLFIAACGGGVRSEAKPESQVRREIPTDRESALLVQSLIQAYGSDAVDTCLAAWQDQRDGHTDNSGPFSKPGAGFRIFLSECVGAPVPGDARSQDGEDMRIQDPRSLRSQGGRDMRIQDPRSLRSQGVDMRSQRDDGLRANRAAELRGTSAQ